MHRVDDGFIECVIDCVVYIEKKLKCINFNRRKSNKHTPVLVLTGIAIAPKTAPSKTCMNGILFRVPSLRRRSFCVESVVLPLEERGVVPGGGR